MHDEHAPAASEYAERAETHLRVLVEAALRPGAHQGSADWVSRAAEILLSAGVIGDQLAAQILADLQVALRVRAMSPVRLMATRLRRLPGFQPGQLPADFMPRAQSWRVFPAGPATAGARPMALIITADRAVAPATLYFPPDADPSDAGMRPFAELTGTDDLGTAYQLGFIGGSWAGSAWTGTVMFLPAPPAAARSLEIISPNGQLLRVDITAALARGPAPGLAVEPTAESPGERLLARQAEAMLTALALSRPPGQSQPTVTEMVATLEAAGVLSPLSPAPARLAALGQLLGLPMTGPAHLVPARWMNVMAYYGLRRRPAPVTGTAAIAAELPELEGARLAIAGLRSGASGTFLHILVTGLAPLPVRRPSTPPWDAGFSWWAKDDAGGWHVGAFADVSPIGGPEGLIRLELLPPLSHTTMTLTIEIAGSGGQITATLPVRW